MKTSTKRGWPIGLCAALFLAVMAGTSCRDVALTAVPVTTVEVVPSDVTLEVGERHRLEAVPRDDGGSQLSHRPVQWRAQDPDVAIVDPDGTVQGASAGVTTVEARTEGAVGEARIEVEQPAREEDDDRDDSEDASDDDEDDEDDEDDDDDEDDEDDEDDDDDEDDEDDDDSDDGKKGKKKGKDGNKGKKKGKGGGP